MFLKSVELRPRTLTSFGFALTLPTDVGCFKFSARLFVRAHPHFVRVRAYTLNRRRAPGRARGRTRPNPAGCGEVASPLFSITSILNATSYKQLILLYASSPKWKHLGFFDSLERYVEFGFNIAKHRATPGFMNNGSKRPRQSVALVSILVN